MVLSMEATLARSQNFALARSQKQVSTTIARLSSGERITRAGDDVASLSVSTSLTTRIRSLRSARTNTLQASSLLQVADAGMREVDEILQRMAGLSTMSNSGGLTDAERGFLDLEFQQLKDEIDRIANETNFNGTKLLNRYVDPIAVKEIKTGIEVEEPASVYLTFDDFAPGSGNAPPVSAAPLVDQTTNTNTAFSYAVPGGSFTDPDGDPLTYTASLADGSPLPGWLTFNAATQTFSGTPTVTDQGVISVRVNATDGSGTASDIFDITVIDPPAPPVVVTPLANQVVGEGSSLVFTMPAQPVSFDDPNLDTLTFSLGAGAPSWLSFNPSSRTFVANPPLGAIGTYNIEVIATDPTALTASSFFQIEVTDVNQAPTDVLLSNNNVNEDEAVGFTVGTLSSVDPDAGDTHTYSIVGDPDNKFTIVGNELRINNPLNFEAKSTHSVTIQTTDAGGLSVARVFTINVGDVNEAPFVVNGVTDRTVNEGAAFSYTFQAQPSGFNDPDGDTLTYSASGMPAWMSFDATTRTFSGNPVNADVGISTITVTADDGNGLSVTDTFNVTVLDVNNAPTLDTPLADQTMNEGDTASYNVAGNFSDLDGDTITYNATLVGGAPLPAFIAFNGTTGEFTFTNPDDADVGTISIRVVASDGSLSVADNFDLTVVNINEAPFEVNGVTDQNVNEGAAFSYTIPAQPTGFDDPDGDTLTYTASGMPAWMSFDATTRTFSGNPVNADVGTSTITVTVDDGNGLTTTDTFDVTVLDVNNAPTLDAPLINQTMNEGDTANYNIAGNFSDLDGDTLTYSATLVGGAPLPAFVTLDSTTGEFTFTNPDDPDVGTISIRVTASDGTLTATGDFDLTVNNINEAPVLNTNLSDQTVAEGATASYQFNATDFTDPDGDALTYSATLVGGAPLPAFISFNAATRTFTFTNPADADVGTYQIEVTASDGTLTATDVFDLTVTDVNNAPDTLIDNNAAVNAVDEGALTGTTVGVTALATDPDGDALTYSLSDNAGGRFAIDANTGVVTVANGTLLDFESATSHDITVEANDGNGGTRTETFTINVNNINEAPVLNTNLSDQTVAEGATASYQFNATDFTDPDGDALTYSATLVGGAPLPAFISFNAATRTFTFTNPADADVGTYQIEVTASDGTLTATDVFDLTVTDVNQAPINLRDDSVLLNTVDEDATNGTIVGVTALADDADGDTLTYSLVNDEGGRFGINASTGVVTVIDETLLDFETDADGDYIIRVRADDGNGGTIEQDFTIKINDINEAPFVTGGLADQTVNEGDVFNYQFGAQPTAFDDEDGDTVTYSASGMPAWMSFNALTRTFSGNPADADVGTTTITVTATDPGGLLVTETFDVTVNDVNNAPMALTDVDGAANNVNENAANGTVVNVTAMAVDPDLDTLTYSLTDNAGGRFAIDSSTGVVTVADGTLLDFETAISHNITVRATDPGGLFTTNTFTINLNDVNEAPFVAAGLTNQTANAGGVFSYTFPNVGGAFDDVDAADSADLLYTVSGMPAWMTFNEATRTFSGIPATGDIGTTSTITVTATDSGGLSVDTDFAVSVTGTAGLQGQIWRSTSAINNLGDAQSIIAGNAPDATFVASAVDYPQGAQDFTNTGPLSAFLGSDIGTMSGLPTNYAMERMVFKLSGQIYVPADGTYQLNVASDDGFQLNIDGSLWSQFTGNRAFTSTNQSGFLSEGFHDIEFIYWENGGQEGFELFSNITGSLTELGAGSIFYTPTHPAVDAGFTDQTATTKQAFSYTFPANAFSDPNGDTLTYTARLEGGAALPAWMTFNAATRTFSGTPPTNVVGTYIVEVIASDGTERVSNKFNFTVDTLDQFTGGTTDGFTYLDDTFRGTSQPNFADGFTTGSGVPSDGVNVRVGGGGGGTVLNMSGGYRKTFTFANTGNATITFNYRLDMANSYENDEYSEILFALDGNLIGVGANDYVRRIAGGGDTGWQTVTLNLGTVSAGTHTITLGGFNNKKTAGGERTDFQFDNVVIDAATPAAVPFASPTTHIDNATTSSNSDISPADIDASIYDNIISNLGGDQVVYYTFDNNDAFDEQMQQMTRAAMREYEAVANVKFIEGKDPSTGNYDLTFATSNTEHGGLYQYWTEDVPSGGYANAEVQISNRHMDYEEMIARTGSYEGSFTYLTIMHEIGHHLGLDDVQENLQGTLYDNSDYTIMSYNRDYEALGGTRFGQFNSDLGAVDIAALTHLYGEKTDNYAFDYGTASSIDTSSLYLSDIGQPDEDDLMASSSLTSSDMVKLFTAPTAAPAPATGDYIVINGIPFSFVVGADANDPTQIEFAPLEEMLKTLVNRLNASTDPRLSQAIYELENPRTIKITTRAGQDVAELYKVADNLAGLRDFITVLGGTEVNDFGAQFNYIAEDGDANKYSFIGSGSVTVSGQSNDGIMLSPANVRAKNYLHMDAIPQVGETLSIDDGNGGFLNFVMVNDADSTDPFEIEIGDTIQDTLDNIVTKLNSWVSDFGTANNSYVMRELDFTWEQDTLIMTGKTASPVLDYRDELANFGTSFTGSSLSSNVMDNALSKGVNADYVANNAFYGTIDNVKANYTNSNQVQLSVKVGDATYYANVSDTTIKGADTAVRFTSERNGFFDIELRAGSGMAVNSDSDADLFADRINAALSGVNFYQERQILNYEPSGALRNSTMSVTLNDYDNPIFFDDVEVTISDNLHTHDGAKIVITANGSRFVADLQNDTDISTNQTLVLINEDDPNEKITLRHAGEEIDLITAKDAETFETLLRRALPFGGFLDRKTIDFQVNAASGEQLRIDIQAVTSAALFREANATINIRTQADAQKAFVEIREAIEELTSRRADLGAFQAQTDSILDNLEDAITNQAGANAVLSDTDIARASTELASQLAKTQATINTIASANQLHSDNLLSLIESLSGAGEDEG